MRDSIFLVTRAEKLIQEVVTDQVVARTRRLILGTPTTLAPEPITSIAWTDLLPFFSPANHASQPTVCHPKFHECFEFAIAHD